MLLVRILKMNRFWVDIFGEISRKQAKLENKSRDELIVNSYDLESLLVFGGDFITSLWKQIKPIT